MISFAIFVWFCMKFVWPPIIQAMEKRKQDIADGLANAEKGNKFLSEAEQKADDQITLAREKARLVVADAEKTSQKNIDASKSKAKLEAEKIIVSANQEIEVQVARAKEELRAQVALLAIQGAEKILQKEIDEKAHEKMLKELSLKL